MPNNDDDNLFVVNPKKVCPVCLGDRIKRKSCGYCQDSGMLPVDISGMWSPSAGFLVCGGPSLNKIDYGRLRERGVVSLGVNNVSAYVPVDAWCFSDPEIKFHHGLFYDPKCTTFAPIPKLRRNVRVKLPDGTFRMTDRKIMDCPGTFGFHRRSDFNPETFFSDSFAHWGKGENGYGCLCTMLIGFRLMHYLGCKKIYLLGVDFWITEKEGYAFEQSKTVRNGRYDAENQMLRDLRVTFDKYNFKVYNCNPDSRCDAFEYMSFDNAIQDCKGAVPKTPFDLTEWYDKAGHEEKLEKYPSVLTTDQVIKIQNG